jgi:hypothetical protein
MRILQRASVLVISVLVAAGVAPAVADAATAACSFPPGPFELAAPGGVDSIIFAASHGDARFNINSSCSISGNGGNSTLTMQGDGNLVLSRNGSAVWGSNTVGQGHHAIFQQDGNLVVTVPTTLRCAALRSV